MRTLSRSIVRRKVSAYGLPVTEFFESPGENLLYLALGVRERHVEHVFQVERTGYARRSRRGVRVPASRVPVVAAVGQPGYGSLAGVSHWKFSYEDVLSS